MTQSEFFKCLGAPLANSRWSWGGSREDGAVVLRVWQDRKRKHDGRWYMMLTHHSKYQHALDNLGYRERNEHVARVRSGSACYMVMCRAVDVTATPRKVLSFDQKDVFVGGALIDLEGDVWIEMTSRIPASTLYPQ